ncbi:MAG: tungstate ABC transporter substrate-binding protein WtpA [Chloroflexota bacterium]|nr:tungstate ABC transporter substrate-binding protein WtpA [Chloroflexota bacterium]
MKKTILSVIAMAFVLSLAAIACGGGDEMPEATNLYVLHAGSLAVPCDQMAVEFEAQHAGVTVVTEGAGSRTTIRKVTEMGKPGDVIGSADYKAIEELMFPDYADWYICFARNQMVIAYRDGAPFADEIVSGQRTWYDVLRNEEVTYGHSDPDADPCGYRTLMVAQLAQAYYCDDAGDFGLTPDADAEGLYDVLIPIPEGGTDMDRGRAGGSWGELVKSKSVDLLYLLESGDLDYAFEYRSVAVQHGFGFIELPEAIDLSDMGYEEFYSTAAVDVTGSEPGTTSTQTGAAIVYGVTIPSNAPSPEMALAFVEFMLGPEGQTILEGCGQPPIVPAIASDIDKLPEELKEYVIE